MVELVRRYSNRADLQERLERARSAAGQSGVQDHEVASTTWGRAPDAQWRVRSRLTDDDVDRLIADFLAGTTKRVLAERYAVGLSTVKRILRKHGVRRR